MYGKILSIAELQSIITETREKDTSVKIVHCHGVFDLLHIGHIRHFKEAKQLGDVLIVTLTSDRYVNKGPDRPVFTEQLRSEAIASVEVVDYVVVTEYPTAVETINILKPDFYVKGKEYAVDSDDLTGKIVDEREAVEAHGGQVVFTDDIVFSSSNLLNLHFSKFPKSTQEFIREFKDQYSVDQVVGAIKSLRDLKVLIVGETIIDEYVYCTSLGTSSKEPIITVQQTDLDTFAGGALAVANHVANFSDRVTVLTMVGDDGKYETLITDKLADNVEPIFFRKSNTPTIVKRRYVEQYLRQKLFSVYEINNTPSSDKDNQGLNRLLYEHLAGYDVVIVLDYGHHMIGAEQVKILTEESSFLAVNTQSNAGNRGHNTISKYPKADFVSLASHEIALELRRMDQDFEDMIIQLRERMEFPHIAVTRGKLGILTYSDQGGLHSTPALTVQVVDRMGAGDAVLSIASLLVKKGYPMDLVGFVGNAAGGFAAATLGHETSLTPIELQKYLVTLLK